MKMTQIIHSTYMEAHKSKFSVSKYYSMASDAQIYQFSTSMFVNYSFYLANFYSKLFKKTDFSNRSVETILFTIVSTLYI